jgi:hypothetical protein
VATDPEVNMSETAALETVTGLPGEMNTPVEVVLEQIRHSIRLQHPQAHIQPVHGDRAVVVGGGPSLAQTEGEIVDLVWSGARLITVNGAYQWCLQRNLKPYAQIVLDAKPSTVAFLEPVMDGVRYYVASQCHPDAWAAVKDADTWIWHACRPEDEERRNLLDAYYGGRWHGIPGGTTVTIQAVMLLRSLGFLRFDLFGVDSCMASSLQHHAYSQPENDADDVLKVEVFPTSRPNETRRFLCTAWHLQQFAELLKVIRLNHKNFSVNVHGNGLLAYALNAQDDITVREVAV